MNFLYVLKKHLKPNNRTIVTSQDGLKKIINQGEIGNYEKFEKINGSVYVICCNKKDSISPLTSGEKGAGYQDDLIFKVTRFDQTTGVLIAFGGVRSNGVYGTSFRIATKKEVENYKNKQTILKWDVAHW